MGGLLGTGPTDQSASPSPPQGLIWHRNRVKSGHRCRIKVESMLNRSRLRGRRGEFESRERCGGGSVPNKPLTTLQDEGKEGKHLSSQTRPGSSRCPSPDIRDPPIDNARNDPQGFFEAFYSLFLKAAGPAFPGPMLNIHHSKLRGSSPKGSSSADSVHAIFRQ